MEDRKLPSGTGNCLIDLLIRAEENHCSVCTGPYGISVTSYFPNGLKMSITCDPYIHLGTKIPDPQSVKSVTIRFVAYTTKTGKKADYYLTTKYFERLLHSEDSEVRETAMVLKEFTGIQLEISIQTYKEAERAIADRERLVLKDIDRLEEEQAQGQSI